VSLRAIGVRKGCSVDRSSGCLRTHYSLTQVSCERIVEQTFPGDEIGAAGKKHAHGIIVRDNCPIAEVPRTPNFTAAT
jgi:hypothetical protein